MRVFVTGGGGQLATDLEIAAAAAGDEFIAPTELEVDITDRAAISDAISSARPDVVIHAAAMTAVDRCETEVDLAFKVNAIGTRFVADAARRSGAQLVYVSTDYVFSGELARPYNEWDETGPLSVYGRSKLAGEHEVRSIAPGSTIARTSWVCGAHGQNMVRTILRLAAEHERLSFVDDQRGHPTFTADLASMLLLLGRERLPGTYHTTNQGAVSWYEFAREVLAAAGLDPARVAPISTADLQPARPAPRPRNSVLDNAALRLAGIEPLCDHGTPLQGVVDRLRGA